MGTFGTDVASFQPPQPDVTGRGFLFVKVTEGQTYVNPLWKAQFEWGLSHGLVMGLYHYPHMANPAPAEVRRFVSVITAAGIDLSGVMLMEDWEGYDQANSGVPRPQQAAFKDAFLHELKAARPTNRTVLYCDKDYWLNVDTTGYFGDALFIAEPGSPGAASIHTTWLFHQYGQNSGYDLDFCTLSLADLRAWATALEDDMTPEQAQQLADLHKALVEPTLKSRIDGGMHTLGEHELATNLDAHTAAAGVAALETKLGEVVAELQAVKAKLGA
jgi:hypothetical protein